VQPEGICRIKIPITASVIELTSFRDFSAVPQPTAAQRTGETSLIFGDFIYLKLPNL
jgi:hypothetical protein